MQCSYPPRLVHGELDRESGFSSEYVKQDLKIRSEPFIMRWFYISICPAASKRHDIFGPVIALMGKEFFEKRIESFRSVDASRVHKKPASWRKCCPVFKGMADRAGKVGVRDGHAGFRVEYFEINPCGIRGDHTGNIRSEILIDAATAVFMKRKMNR